MPRHAADPAGRTARTANPLPFDRAGLDRAAVQRGPLAHPDQPVAAGRDRQHPTPSSHDLDPHVVRAVGERDLAPATPPHGGGRW